MARSLADNDLRRCTQPLRSAPTTRVRLSPKVYRDIEIDSRKSLYALAAAIVRAFGFYNKLTGNIYDSPVRYELFADLDGDSNAGSVKHTKVAQAFPKVGHKVVFLFDYGHQWEFRVEVIGVGERVPKTRYPKVLAVVGEAPPQYPDVDEDDE